MIINFLVMMLNIYTLIESFTVVIKVSNNLLLIDFLIYGLGMI